MKKVIGIFMMMVMVFVVVSMALGEENPCTVDCYEMRTYLDEWIDHQKGEEYEQTYVDGSIYYTTGVVCNSEFYNITGEYFTPEKMEEMYLHADEYGEPDYKATEASVKLVGMYENYNVYELRITTINVPIVTFDGMEYYKGVITFIVGK